MTRRFLIRTCLLLLASLPLAAFAAPKTAVAGQDYVLIENGQTWQPLAGKIEVAEVFAYACGHCARFQPLVDAWKRKLPANVRLSYVPLPYSKDDPFARGFFAAQAAGALDKTHAATFVAVHDKRTLASNPSIDEMAAFYAQYGLRAAKMKAAMEAPALADRLAAARQFAVRNGVEGTPSLIVNGRYRVQGDSLQELLDNADALIAQLRKTSR